jgi:hypothetical protein
MTTTADLPQPGEPIIMPDDSRATVAWCSGWTWPIGAPAPTRLYAQAEDAGKVLAGELRVVAARDALGARFWIAERRTP